MRILSLGAGVQSTTIALMAARGEISAPDAAIFADTGDESPAVYKHLSWLMSPNILPFPIYITRQSLSLSEALKSGDEAARVPFFVGSGGMGMRQCTRNWKLRPIRRMTREILGKGKRDYIAPKTVDALIGISIDEVYRLKCSDVKYINNVYPLVDLGMSRDDCVKWLRNNQYKLPPKSSCVFCPYKSNKQWDNIKLNDINSWNKAVSIDRWLREPKQIIRFHGELYVHKSRVPLTMVQLSSKKSDPDNMFNNECEGLCGI